MKLIRLTLGFSFALFNLANICLPVQTAAKSASAPMTANKQNDDR
jgi:hypothetical protein